MRLAFWHLAHFSKERKRKRKRNRERKRKRKSNKDAPELQTPHAELQAALARRARRGEAERFVVPALVAGFQLRGLAVAVRFGFFFRVVFVLLVFLLFIVFVSIFIVLLFGQGGGGGRRGWRFLLLLLLLLSFLLLLGLVLRGWRRGLVV